MRLNHEIQRQKKLGSNSRNNDNHTHVQWQATSMYTVVTSYQKIPTDFHLLPAGGMPYINQHTEFLSFCHKTRSKLGRLSHAASQINKTWMSRRPRPRKPRRTRKTKRRKTEKETNYRRGRKERNNMENFKSMYFYRGSGVHMTDCTQKMKLLTFHQGKQIHQNLRRWRKIRDCKKVVVDLWR